jgi:hypothetical protein
MVLFTKCVSTAAAKKKCVSRCTIWKIKLLLLPSTSKEELATMAAAAAAVAAVAAVVVAVAVEAAVLVANNCLSCVLLLLPRDCITSSVSYIYLCVCVCIVLFVCVFVWVNNLISHHIIYCSTKKQKNIYAHYNILTTGGPNFHSLFSDYAANRHHSSSDYTELPGEIKRAELHCYSKNPSARVQNFAMTTEMGIYHGSLLFANTTDSGSENVLLEAQLIPFVTAADFRQHGLAAPGSSNNAYGSNSNSVRASSASSIEQTDRFLDRPVSIAVTEFHFLTLRGDRLQVISRLNGLPVQVRKEVAIGLVVIAFMFVFVFLPSCCFIHSLSNSHSVTTYFYISATIISIQHIICIFICRRSCSSLARAWP